MPRKMYIGTCSFPLPCFPSLCGHCLLRGPEELCFHLQAMCTFLFFIYLFIYFKAIFLVCQILLRRRYIQFFILRA